MYLYKQIFGTETNFNKDLNFKLQIRNGLFDGLPLYT